LEGDDEDEEEEEEWEALGDLGLRLRLEPLLLALPL
jgi:hypothetical protein